MDKVVTNEKVLVGGDFNDHVGSDVGGFGEAHGVGGRRWGGVGSFGQINDEYLFPEKKKSDYNIYHGVQKEGQEETKIQKEIETVEFERVRGKRIVC